MIKNYAIKQINNFIYLMLNKYKCLKIIAILFKKICYFDCDNNLNMGNLHHPVQISKITKINWN